MSSVAARAARRVITAAKVLERLSQLGVPTFAAHAELTAAKAAARQVRS